jgi:hypothetical protein
MSDALTTAQQKRYAELAARMESGDFSPIDPDPGASRAIDSDELPGDESFDASTETPVLPVEAADYTVDDVRVALGRPSLSGGPGTGRSPKRQVRLPLELDQLLDQRMRVEQRTASEILRDALERYLRAS